MKFKFKKKNKITKDITPKTNNDIPDVVKEIIGGLNNALSRGETMQNAMQSFANAGYEPENIITASGYISEVPKNIETSKIENELSKAKATKKVNLQNKKIMGLKPITFFLILGISIIFLVGALLLGLNWSKIF